jgi:hypothetical protein
MESAGEAKYFSDLSDDHTAAEASFGQILDGDACRDHTKFFVLLVVTAVLRTAVK